MKTTRKRDKRKYALKDSAFFRIKSIHVLARILQTRPAKLKRGSSLYNCYIRGSVPKSENEVRETETPFGELRRIHERVLQLFSRNETPDFLHSGVKGRSYVTNASAHIGNFETVTLDIRKFFPITKWHHIYLFFSDQLECSNDVSAVLANLLTIERHLPTGSPLSTLMSYFIHKNMFDDLHSLCQQNNILMTLYVDDLAFYGPKISSPFLDDAKKRIRAQKLEFHKERHKHNRHQRKITGVIVTKTGTKWPNSKHKESFDVGQSLRGEFSSEKREAIYRKYMSRISQGSQIDQSLKSRLVALKAAKSNILRK